MTRLEANNKLLNILSTTLRQYPDYRFGQALFNLGLVQRSSPGNILDPLYEESQHTLERILDAPLFQEPATYECNFNVAVEQMFNGHKFTSPHLPGLIFSMKDGNYVATTTLPPVAEGHMSDYAPPFEPTDLPVVLTPTLLSATFVKYNPPYFPDEEPTTTNSSN